MKKTVTIYLPMQEAGDRPSITYKMGENQVRDITAGEGYVSILFDDYGGMSVYHGMPFEYHQQPEEEKDEVPY